MILDCKKAEFNWDSDQTCCFAAPEHAGHGGEWDQLFSADVRDPDPSDPPRPLQLRPPGGHVKLRLALKILLTSRQSPLLPGLAQCARYTNNTQDFPIYQIIPKAQATSNKMKHEKRHKFWAQVFVPSNAMRISSRNHLLNGQNSANEMLLRVV